MGQPARIPLVEQLETRDQTLNYDRKILNGLVEQGEGSTLRVIKRPGNRLAFSGTAGMGQGIANYLNNLYTISGDFLNSFATTSSLSAQRATAAAGWSNREGHMVVGFAGKLWVMGGFMSPALAAPTFTATVSGGSIATITANTLGQGYAPGYPTTLNLIISGGGGSNGAATVTVSGQSITGPVTITNAGTGYTSAPTVTISTSGWGVMNDIWSSVDGINWNQLTTAAPWAQRGRGNAIVFNNKIWITGGTTGTGANASDKAYGDVWSSPDGTTWTQANPSAFPPRYRHGVTEFNNLLWVSGGAGLIVPSNPTYPNTFYSDVYSSPDGVSWTKTASQAPWVARANHAFFSANNLLWVVGGRLSDAFSLATGDSWSSPDGTTWTRASTNPFGVAASGVWPVAALNSQGMDYTMPPPVTVTGGTGGSGATAWAFNTFVDDDDNNDDMQAGPIIQVTFNNVGSGYTGAPTLSFGTSTGVNAGAYAFLDGTSNGGSKQLRASTIGSTTYLFEFADGGTYVHAIWATTDGVTYTNLGVSFASGWVPRGGEWIAYGNLWMMGGMDATPTYYNDVWYISLGGSSFALNPQVPLGFYHFTQTSTSIATPLLVFKSLMDLYSFNASLNLLTKLSTSANYPASTVPGIVYLDGVFYVMDTKGNIYGSGANDPSSWTALNKVTMQNEPNGGMALAKIANYVVGFGVWTIEFFYDAGNAPPSSALSPNQTLPIQVGCASGESVIEMQGTVVWIGQTRREGQGVYVFNGYTPQRISTTYVDRLIQNDSLSLVRAYTLDLFGHSHYILKLVNSNVTLAYDFTTQVWTVFTSLTPAASISLSSLVCDPYGTVTATCTSLPFSDGDPVVISGASNPGFNGSYNIGYISPTSFTYQVGTNLGTNSGTAVAQGYATNQFSPVASAQVLDVDYVQDPTSGQIFSQDIFDYTDAGNPVDLQVVTERWDAGTTSWKFFRKLILICDSVASSALLRYSDYDYTSWSSYRAMVLNQGQRPFVGPAGRSRRRAFQLRHTAATPFRAEAIELEIYLGDN